MRAYAIDLGEVFISDMYLCGNYKYGYAKNCLVRYHYQLATWSIACVIQ
jgi:hypothetical protein